MSFHADSSDVVLSRLVLFAAKIPAFFLTSIWVSGLGGSSFTGSFGSSSIIYGFRHPLTVTAIKNCFNQILNCLDEFKFVDAQNTGIIISVLLSCAENPAM